MGSALTCCFPARSVFASDLIDSLLTFIVCLLRQLLMVEMRTTNVSETVENATWWMPTRARLNLARVGGSPTSLRHTITLCLSIPPSGDDDVCGDHVNAFVFLTT
jgi:hypothetical protein